MIDKAVAWLGEHALSQEVKKEIIVAVKDFIKEILRPNLELDEMADMYSPKLDELIRSYQRQGMEYAAGKFRIVHVNEKQFAVSFELYFKDDKGKWQQISNMSEAQDVAYLTEKARETLRTKRVIAWPVDAPSDKIDSSMS